MTRRFPIQGGPAIPWDALAPHERQAERNHDQSLETLARRGGLSPCEAVAILEDRPWTAMDATEAKRRMVELVQPFEALSRELARVRETFDALLIAEVQTYGGIPRPPCPVEETALREAIAALLEQTAVSR